MKIKRTISFTIPNTEEGRKWAEWYKNLTENKCTETVFKHSIVLRLTEKTHTWGRGE